MRSWAAFPRRRICTSRCERLAGKEKRPAVITALSTSIPSIIVSGMGLFAATFGVALYSNIDIVGSMCMLMARGAIISVLLVLLVLGMVVSGVVGAFEKVVSRLTIIMAFQSLILDMAGNVGTQSLAVTIRVLMDKEITARKKLGLVCKEMRVGLFSGLILGSLSVLFVGAYIMLGKGYPAQYAFAVSVCIGAALLLAMFISSAVGTLIPMFFKRIGVDPAVASGPLITTVNDLVAVVTYYGLSWLLLLQALHLGS